MSAVKDSLTLYSRYIGVSIRGQMQYRASFFMLMIGHFLSTLIEFGGIWALFARFGSLRGWTLPEVGLLYGIVNTAFAIAEGVGRGFDTFPALVKSGDFDRLLLRPRGTALQVVAQEMQLMRMGRFLQGLFVLLWAGSRLPHFWTPGHMALLALSISGGACLFGGLFVFQAAMSFWTIETLELMNTLTYGGTETGQFPLTIYRPWFRRFFTFVVPIASINILPLSALVPHPGLTGISAGWVWITPLAGVLFLAASLGAWRVGVRHYVSTGS